MIKNFTKTLLMANWVLCLIVSFISSANAADEAVNPMMTFSRGNAVTIHAEHRPRLNPLCKLEDKDRVAWHKGLTEIGYLKTNSTQSNISVQFYMDYGGLFGKTQSEVRLPTWQACDQTFEKSIIAIVKSCLEREGIPLNPKEIEIIKERLNPSRGTVRGNEDLNRFHILTLDKNRLFKLHLNIKTKDSISSEWTCNRYIARMEGYLDVGIYQFLDRAISRSNGATSRSSSVFSCFNTCCIL